VAAGSATPVSAANAKPSDIAAVTGITTVAGTTNGDVRVRSGMGNNSLTVNEAISTAAGTAATAGGAVILEAGGAITLASNGTISTTGNTSGAGGDVFIHHTNAAAGAITLGKTILATGGASGNGGNITVLNDSGAISLDATLNVSKGAGTDGTIALKATGDITDTTNANLIGDTDGSLKAWSTGGKITLTQGATVAGTAAGEMGNAGVGHQIKTAAFKTDTAAGTDGSVKYLDRTDLTVGTVAAGSATPVSAANAKPSDIAAVTGITTVAGTTNGDVLVRAGTGGAGAMNVNEAILTTPNGNGATAGSSVILEAGGTITLQTNGTITTTGQANNAGTGGAGGEIFIHHTNAAAGSITLGKAVTADGGASTGGTNTGGAGGVVTIQNDSGAIAVNAALSANGGTGSTAAGNGGTVQLNASTGITQSAALTATGATAGSLMVRAGDDVTLQTAGNDFNKIAASISSGGKFFKYSDSNAVDIGSVTRAATLIAPSATAATTGNATLAGITTLGGALNLNGSTISLVDNITTQGGAVSITGTTLVSQPAGKAITTTASANSGAASGAISINVTGTGALDLSGDLVTTGAANNAGVGSAGGNVTIDTANGTLAVANISTSGGASANAASNGGAAGTIAINTGTNNTITLNGSTLTAAGGAAGAGGLQGSGGSISFGDPVTLASGTVSISTGATAGDITFAQTVNGNRDLTLTAGTGVISFNGAVGGITPLGDGTGAALSITSGATTFNSTLATASGISSDANVVFKENVTLGAGDTASALNANTTFNRVGGLTFTAGRQATFGDSGTDQITLSQATTITTAAANADQVFNAKVDGASSLSVAAGSGSVVFSGAVGSLTPLTNLTISGGGISLASIVVAGSGVTGNVDIKGGGAISQSGVWTIGGNLWATTTSGNITLKSLNVLPGKVSLIASGTGAEVWLYASNIDVNTVEAPSGAGGVIGILGTTVILQADSGTAFQAKAGLTGGLVKATSTATTTAALKILTNGSNGNAVAGAIGSTADLALRIETSGLVVVEGSGVSDGTINLKGDDKVQPKYEFSGNPLYRRVLYNGNDATNAQLTGALDAAYLDIRNLTTEIRESGFSKENASKVLRRGVVTSAGPGQPAVDDSTGMAGAEECEGGFANGSLSCQ
jgi:hypothetical protein